MVAISIFLLVFGLITTIEAIFEVMSALLLLHIPVLWDVTQCR
jgi:hypothetical protein